MVMGALKFAGHTNVYPPAPPSVMMNLMVCPGVGFTTVELVTFAVKVIVNVGIAKVEASKTGVALKVTAVLPWMSPATRFRNVGGAAAPLVGPASTNPALWFT